MIGEVGPARLGFRLAHADAGLLALAALLTIARFLLQALRWEVLVRREAPVGLRQIAPILMAGNFLNLVTPALRVAGPILRAWYLSRETGRPRARFYGTIVADQAANFTIYALAVAVGVIFVPMPGSARVAPVLGPVLLAALIAGLAGAWMLLRRIRRGARPLLAGWIRGGGAAAGPTGGRRDRLAGWWDDLAHSLAHAVVGSGAWWPAILLSAAMFAAIVAAQVVSFAAIGSSVGVWQAAFAVAGAGLIQVMAASPGGSGVTEASLIWVFMTLGLDGETAAAGVLLARCLNYAVLLPWGGWSFYVLQHRHGMPRDAAPEPGA